MARQSFVFNYTPQWGAFENQWRDYSMLAGVAGLIGWIVGFVQLHSWYSRLISQAHAATDGQSESAAFAHANGVWLLLTLVAILSTVALIGAIISFILMPRWWRFQANRHAAEIRETDYDLTAPAIRELVAKIAGYSDGKINFRHGTTTQTLARFPFAWFHSVNAAGVCSISTARTVEIFLPPGADMAQVLALLSGGFEELEDGAGSLQELAPAAMAAGAKASPI